jgi:hypothetical protein
VSWWQAQRNLDAGAILAGQPPGFIITGSVFSPKARLKRGNNVETEK